MRNMSFALTTSQVLCQTKFVTRRFGWDFLKPGDLVRPVRKAMGPKKGKKIEPLGCPIRIESSRWEAVEAYKVQGEIKSGADEGHPQGEPVQ